MNANLCKSSAVILVAAWIASSRWWLHAQPPEVTDSELRTCLEQVARESYHANSQSNAVNTAAVSALALLNGFQQQDLTDGGRYQLAAAIARIGPPAHTTAPILARWLRDSDTIVQYHAFVALGRVNPQPPLSLEALDEIQRLGSAVPEVQYATLCAMQLQAALRTGQISTVINIVKETDHRGLKCFALETLGLIGSADLGALRTILACVAESNEFISEAGVRALRRIDATHVELVPLLAAALYSSNWKTRYHAAEALREFGPRAKPAVPALVAALSRADSTDKHYWVGVYLEALRAVGPGAVEAADQIVRLLPERSALYRNRSKHEVEQLRAFMLVTLSEVGTPDAAFPFVLDALANSDTLRIYTAGAIAAGAMAARAADAAPFLLRALRPGVREFTRDLMHTAATGVDNPLTFESYLGNGPKSGVYTSARIEAIRALGKIGPAAKTATELLTELAQGEEKPQQFLKMPLLCDEARMALTLIKGQQAANKESRHPTKSFPSSAKATQ